VPVTLYDSAGAQDREQKEPGATRVVIGTVVNNCDLIRQGKVLVRVPSLDEEIYARLTAVGGGAGAGILYVPRIGDEVVVAESRNDAFVLGGLWSSADGPPVDVPLEAPTKRVIKTGLQEGFGHELAFDDLRQSIEVVSSTEQRITLDPQGIEVSNAAGTLTIALDEATQTITIKGVNVTIEAAAKLTLKGRVTEVKAEPGPLRIGSASVCSLKGTPIQLNCIGP
jgi:uncharacterized protein involved in type VI secretion and phage assembly